MTLLKNLIVATVLVAQSANAWQFVWRDSNGVDTVEGGLKKSDCVSIDHAQGKLFEWDPQQNDVCIFMYGEEDCTGGIKGMSCPVWDKKSSQDIKAFRVNYADNASTGDSTATATETGSATPTESETVEPTSTGSPTETSGDAGSPTPSGTEAPPTGSSSAPAASDEPSAPTQTGAASATGAPVAGLIGALAAVAAVAL